MPQGDRNGKLRKAVEVVGRAVQRVDDPLERVLAMAAALFGEDGVAG